MDRSEQVLEGKALRGQGKPGTAKQIVFLPWKILGIHSGQTGARALGHGLRIPHLSRNSDVLPDAGRPGQGIQADLEHCPPSSLPLCIRPLGGQQFSGSVQKINGAPYGQKTVRDYIHRPEFEFFKIDQDPHEAYKETCRDHEAE